MGDDIAPEQRVGWPRRPCDPRTDTRARFGGGPAIFGGIIVFHDPIGSGIAARFVAFCLVIAGAALMPAPMRATPDAASAAVQPTSGTAAGSG
jgi:hypothetical protein